MSRRASRLMTTHPFWNTRNAIHEMERAIRKAATFPPNVGSRPGAAEAPTLPPLPEGTITLLRNALSVVRHAASVVDDHYNEQCRAPIEALRQADSTFNRGRALLDEV